MSESQILLKISNVYSWHDVIDSAERKNARLGRNLLQDTAQKPEDPEKSGGLSVAWIAAIVINAILIALFILVVIYCYCKNRKQRDLSQSDSIRKDYHSNGDIMYVEKAAVNRAPDKAALIGTDTVYTVEGDRGRYRRHVHHHHAHGEDERCNCTSPECYCSMGDEDGRQIESRSRNVERMFREEPEEEVKENRMPSPEPEPFAATPQVEEVWRSDSDSQQHESPREEDLDVRFSPPPPTPPPDPMTEKHYQIYRVINGSKTNIGQLVLPGDQTLNELRQRMQEHGSLSVAAGNNFRFLNEELFELSVFQETTLDLDHVYPYQAIYVKSVQLKKDVKKKAPTYVGPLGICSAPDCTNPARIKCLDCGNSSYCSTKCQRNDISNHKRRCYKPPWRI